MSFRDQVGLDWPQCGWDGGMKIEKPAVLKSDWRDFQEFTDAEKLRIDEGHREGLELHERLRKTFREMAKETPQKPSLAPPQSVQYVPPDRQNGRVALEGGAIVFRTGEYSADRVSYVEPERFQENLHQIYKQMINDKKEKTDSAFSQTYRGEFMAGAQYAFRGITPQYLDHAPAFEGKIEGFKMTVDKPHIGSNLENVTSVPLFFEKFDREIDYFEFDRGMRDVFVFLHGLNNGSDRQLSEMLDAQGYRHGKVNPDDYTVVLKIAKEFAGKYRITKETAKEVAAKKDISAGEAYEAIRDAFDRITKEGRLILSRGLDLMGIYPKDFHKVPEGMRRSVVTLCESVKRDWESQLL